MAFPPAKDGAQGKGPKMNGEAWNFLSEPLPEEAARRRYEAEFYDTRAAVEALKVSGARVAISTNPVYAWLVVHGYMDLDNRARSTILRGRVFIHAVRKMSVHDYGALFRYVGGVSPEAAAALPPYPQLRAEAFGRILGSVRLDGVYAPNPAKFTNVWHTENNYGYRLTEPVALRAGVHAKGLPGFWTVHSDLLKLMEA